MRADLRKLRSERAVGGTEEIGRMRAPPKAAGKKNFNKGSPKPRPGPEFRAGLGSQTLPKAKILEGRLGLHPFDLHFGVVVHCNVLQLGLHSEVKV